MKLLFIFLLTIFSHQIVFSQAQDVNWGLLAHRKAIVTVFDSVLVAKTGLGCEELYNKTIAEYFKANNYKGNKYRKGAVNLNESIPLVLINGRDFLCREAVAYLSWYKSVKSWRYIKKEDKEEIKKYYRYCDCDVIVFEASEL